MPSVKLLESITDYDGVENALKKHIPASVARALDPQLNSNYEIVKFNVVRNIDAEDLNVAIGILSESLEPCSKDIAMKAMHALKVRTADTPAEREIAEERIAVYLSDIISYPPDVVVAACRSWANHNKWFPAWADLYRELEWRIRKRKKALEALNGI